MVFLIMLIILVFIGSVVAGITGASNETHSPLIFEEEVFIVHKRLISFFIIEFEIFSG